MTSPRSRRRLVTTIPGSSGHPDYSSGSSSAVPNERPSGGDPAPHSAHQVFALAESGDEAARAVVDNVARRIGEAIASVIAVVDPELVVLGGAIGSNPALLAPVRATVAQLVPLTARIETSRLGDRAALFTRAAR